MAIAFGSALNGGRTSGLTHTFSVTTAGSDRLLLVAAGFGGAPGDTMTGATYNGVAMTLVQKLNYTGTYWIYLYALVNPATGANNVVISNTDAGQSVYGLAAYYTGVSQTGMPDVVATNTGTGTSLTTNLTTLANNSWTFLFGTANGTGIAASTGSTFRAEGDFDFLEIYDSNAVITPAGATSMAFTATSGANGSIMVSFAPVSAGSTNDALIVFRKA